MILVRVKSNNGLAIITIYDELSNNTMDFKYRLDKDNIDKELSLITELGRKLSVKDLLRVLNKMYNKNDDSVVDEKLLVGKDRKNFGLPKLSKYPMPDKEHVSRAIGFFNKCPSKYRKELAGNINKYIKKYVMKDISISSTNKFSKYFHPLDEVTQVGATSYLSPGVLISHERELHSPGTNIISKLYDKY